MKLFSEFTSGFLKAARTFVPLLVLLLVAGGCGGGKNPDAESLAAVPDTQKIGQNKYEILQNSGNLQIKDGALTGSGIIRMAIPLAKADSANNYNLRFRLAPGGSLALRTHAGKSLEGGITVIFNRSPQPQIRVLEVLVLTDKSRMDVSYAFNKISAQGDIYLSMDIHNDHGDGIHFIAWDGNSGEKLFGTGIRGRGFGTNWGLVLNEAAVTDFKNGHQRDDE